MGIMGFSWEMLKVIFHRVGDIVITQKIMADIVVDTEKGSNFCSTHFNFNIHSPKKLIKVIIT